MQKVLIVVDYQYDFVSGSLPVAEADKIAANIQREIDNPKYDSIIYTLDTHIAEDYFKSEEGKMFPIHCEFNTPGWDFYKIKPINREVGMIINEGIMEEPKDFSVGKEFVFMKDKFSIWEGNNSYSEWFRNTFNKDTEVTVVGVALEVCVFENIKGLKKHEYKNIIVKEDCTKALSIENKNKIINELKIIGYKYE